FWELARHCPIDSFESEIDSLLPESFETPDEAALDALVHCLIQSCPLPETRRQLAEQLYSEAANTFSHLTVN
ncbi:hypothetical protein, partial [Sansalvadorimonas verongulae]|uniref:hypothetical protein n=1 Tax=Sansalvadorimonas verongulae TaxID=2172824 RepID=UPI001E4FA3E5